MSHIVKLPTFKQQGHGSALRAWSICDQWVTEFTGILRTEDFQSLDRVFAKDAWIRDFLTLSWDFRTIHGREKLIDYFAVNSHTAVSNISLRQHGVYSPTFKNPVSGLQWVESMFEFDNYCGRGKGMIRLVMDGEDNDKWKCYLINFTLQELRGYEEKAGLNRPTGYVDGPGGNWQERRDIQREFLDEDPVVLIVGAGQAGLTIAARLRQMGVPSLVIERSGRVGDSWRRRYKTLTTHDPIQYCHLPYIPFPAHWPYFMPKDKLADWLEAYASVMELNVWCNTELQGSSFDEASKSWTISAKRTDGSVRTLAPKHVVLATGNAGDAIVPRFPGQEDYRGVLYHGSQHTDATAHGDLSNKKIVVVGSGNSAHDLCQNFHESGAKSVTMLQRGGTYVITADKGLQMLHTGTYEEGGPPTEDCDISGQSMPIPIQFALNVHGTKSISAVDKDKLDGLAKAGFQLDFGDDGSGIYKKYITRGGGYYIDVGCSQLIIDGKVDVKPSPRGIKSFTSKGLLLADGSEVNADIVVLATGYETMHSTARKLFGNKVASRLGKAWDLDDQGEINSIWRYSGHPNFWFMGGSLALCRSYSLLLALQIKASELGIYHIPRLELSSSQGACTSKNGII